MDGSIHVKRKKWLIMKTVQKSRTPFFYLIFIAILFIAASEMSAQQISGIECIHPHLVLSNVPFNVNLRLRYEQKVDELDLTPQSVADNIRVDLNANPTTDYNIRIDKGDIIVEALKMSGYGNITLDVTYSGFTERTNIFVVPGVLSLLPPLLAIILALIARQVFISLFCGIWIGASILNHYHPVLGFLRTIDKFFIEALAEPSHIAIVIFSMTLGGMIGVISKSGGTRGIVKKLSKLANKRRGGLITTWAMGILIFFDDYANTLVVGNTMRPFTDRLLISREKLSYIVDSTAAPVASIAFISSWVGFQVGLIDSTFDALNISRDPYLMFIHSIPYSIYSILCILFVLFTGITLRDMFSMRKAEMRAYHTHELISTTAQPLVDTSSTEFEPDADIDTRWYNALIPIVLVIFATLIGLYYSGSSNLNGANDSHRIAEIIGAANSFDALMWASFLGSIVAIILAVSQKILNLSTAFNAWLAGVKAMVIAMLILTLAWALGNVCLELHTADFVIESIKSILSPRLLPLITFLTAAFIGFSTGTSWATMAILIPIVIPASIKLTALAGFPPSLSEAIMIATLGAVLSGSVFGDHCSPISDTTIMSSMASASDHIDHVRTQLPYALLIASISCISGYLPAGYGFNISLSLLIGSAALFAILFIFGKKMTNNVPSSL